MSNLDPQPSTPTDWLEAGVSISILSDRQVLGLQSTSIHRDVYLDEPAIINQPAQLLYVYADVFALTKPDITISPPAYGLIQVQSRVLTAATPVNLNIVPDSAGCQLWIFASILNQPVKVSTSGADPVSLDLGPESGNSGVHLTILPGKVDVKYQKGYNPASLPSQPAIYPQLSAQGVALGQQLAAQVMTGPDIGYAPVLSIQNYETVHDALNTVSAFETQYTCFQDKKQSLEDQLKIRDTMIQQAVIQAQIHSYLKKSALGKYNDAQTVVSRCVQQLISDNTEINSASNAFQKGLQDLAVKQWFGAALDIMTNILKFSSGVGVLSLGDQQILFAETKGIGGAAAYNWLCGSMVSVESNKDIADLKELRAQFSGQEKIYAQVEAKFYSRFLGIRNSLTMEMRRLADLLTLDSEIESTDEKYATDFQHKFGLEFRDPTDLFLAFNYSVGSSKLPSNYGQQLIDGLRSESHRASFTLTADDPNGHQGFASIFTDGSRFRLNGLKTFLSGAFPNPEAVVGGVVQVDIQILTSGIYADIKDVTIWQFASVPRSVLLSYDLDTKGNRGTTHVHATFPTKEHAELTLFM
ncbi:uncharacterized protein BDW43DRAFT_313448 [Aspergillus alliaceus]|uniref:uncharacterized protein n=1 Tax=Petromyces alliaceus TaxID=209559 RepID=UPI0012A77906|nr:uncharacterized protein BDW43DRAFT_313448 [Aspergillus alliaceus]KAB8231123.1 hypothetical protein BDW43DRAFT_313448 [Aspergillus alliaceus]